MAINACTINAFTINSARCRTPNLFRPPVPTGILGTNNSSVSADFAKQFPHLVRHVDHDLDDQPALQFEQPFVTVTAELMGATGTQTLEARVQLEFVTVTDLQVSAASSVQDVVTVNITDFKVE